MAKVGTISIDLVANTGKLLAPLRSAERQVQSFGKAVHSSLGGALSGVRSMLTGTTAKLALLTGGLGVGGLATYAVKQAMAFEDAQTAFATFLRSGTAAKQLLGELQKFSDVTPFTAEQVQTAGRGLLAFGFAAEDIIPTLQYLGDAAAGSQQDINELVNILGKIKSKGKLQLEELNRFTERGIVIIPELAKQMRVADKEIYKLITAGKLGFGDVERALKSLNSQGGLFENAMVNLSRTASGKLSTLKSEFNNMMRDVGTAIMENLGLKDLLDTAIATLAKYRESIAKSVGSIVRQITDSLRPQLERIKEAFSTTGDGGEWAFGEQIADAVKFCADRIEDMGDVVFWMAGQWKDAEIAIAAFSVAVDRAVKQASANLRELGNYLAWMDREHGWMSNSRQFLGFGGPLASQGMGGKPRYAGQGALAAPYDIFGANEAQKGLLAFVTESERLLTGMMHRLNRKTPNFVRAIRDKLAEDAQGPGGKAPTITPEPGLSVGTRETAAALERGSQEAFHAINATIVGQKAVEQKQLDQLTTIAGVVKSWKSGSLLFAEL